MNKLKIISVLLFCNLFLFCDFKKDEAEGDIKGRYSDYFIKNDSIISSKDFNRLVRDKLLTRIKNNEIYKKLVDNKEVEFEHLKALHIICSGIITLHSYDVYSLGESEMQSLTSDERDFVFGIISLSMISSGGVTMEIVEVFERYKKKFRLFGQKGYFLIHGGEEAPINITKNFDLSPFFLLIKGSFKK